MEEHIKKTYAYVKYAAPKPNKHGSFAAGQLTALCLGVTLNLTNKDRYIYKQAEIEYPEDRFCLQTTEGRRDLVDGEGQPQDLNALLGSGHLRGRMFRGMHDTVIFTCLSDLSSGQPKDLKTQNQAITEHGLRCPECLGAGKVTACVDCADRRQSGVRKINCPNCAGTGEVTREFLERRAEGEARRQDRILRGASLREDAKRLGVTPQELSDREHGRLPAEGEAKGEAN